MVITELAVFTIDRKGDAGMVLVQLADGVSEAEVREKTEADYRVALSN
jgi:3-oxoacid CoA-transferase subunit B